MAKFDFDLGIIGGGAAGLTVASGAAQLGAKVVLIEREEKLGGDCLHYGCVPSKALIKTARIYHQASRSADFGLPEMNPGPVDFARVSERIKGVIAAIQHHDSEERFCGLGARVEFGRAVFVNEHTVDTGEKALNAARWVIATGSSPAAPPLPGLERAGYLTNRELFYLDRLPGSLIVIGAGPIAIEMAQAMGRLGSRVTVIQRSGQILSREDKDMAEVVQKALEAEGVTIHLNAVLNEVGEQGGQKRVSFTDRNGNQAQAQGDALLVALGRKANVEGMGLESAGVEYTPKGVVVDSRLRTSQKHIFACGDAAGPPQFTHAAGYEGGVVLANAVFRLPRKVDYTWLPWCTYSEPELASIGMNEKAAEKAGLECAAWVEEFADNDRAQAEGAPRGRIKMLVNGDEKPLGVQIVGPHSGELINEWVAALNGKVKLSALAGAMHPYPTLGEINKRVAGDLLAPKLFSEKVKKGLKFFFHLKGRACRLEAGKQA